MCGIGLLLSFSENNADLTTSDDDDNSTSATDDHANEIQTREFIIECNQRLSEALTARGPDVPRRQCYFVGDSLSCVSGEDGIIRPISQVVSNTSMDEKNQTAQNNYDGSNNNWSLTLHASVLHMRGESAMAQPVLFQSLMENGSGVDAGRNEHETMRKLNKNSMESADGGCNSMHAKCALCWNGECYTYQQNSAGANDDAQQERKNQDSNLNRNTNVLDGTMVELISSTSTSTSKTEHSRSQSSVLKMTADSDTMLVKNILLNAIADSRGFYSTDTHDKRQRNSNSNIDDSQSTLREHEAIVNAMSRIHGEFSFILFVPSLSPRLYSSQNSSMSGSTMTNESHANHHASSPGYVYYGRDCLGRRSLLINKSTKGAVVLSSVAIEGTTTNNNIDIDGDGANTDRSANNDVAAKFHASWEEISPGIVYKMNVCTGEITSLYIPKIVNKEVDALASAVGEHTTIFPKGDLIHESIEQSNHEHAASGLLRLLDRAVQRRVMHAPTPNSNSTNDASVAVLFSGGIDSVVLAALSHRHVPLLQPIDLINVSFYSGAESASSSDGRRDSIPPSPDRLAAILSFREMQRRWPKRNWRFIAVDVSYQEVLQYEAHILRLISPLDSTMDFNIAVAFWFAGRGSGRILEQDEAEERRNELESKGSKLGTDVATLSQEPLLRFAKQRMPGNTKGNNKNQSQKSSKKHVHCVRVGCPRSAAPSGCVFGTACSFCCGKLQSPISSFLGRSARMCPHHNHSNAGSSNKSPHKTFPKNVNVCSVAKSKGSGARDDRALCENTKSLGIRCNKVTSTAKILLSGVGADEQMAGYGRHRTTYQRGGYSALRDELRMETNRLWTRNLGRDDRCLSDHGKESRFPYLDEDVVAYLEALPVELKCDMTLSEGEGDKLILRIVARMIGVEECSSLVKRAIQFGSRIAKGLTVGSMVNGKVIRGAGLVILVGSYIWMDSTFTNNVVKKADSLFAELVGEGRGSMYNTCSEESKTLKKLTSVNLAEKASSDLKYNFYSINNPKEYLGGDDATVVEKGPYILRKHSVAYDVSQTTSDLSSETTPDPKGNLEYSTANAYLVLDQDVKATSNLERNADLSLSFSGNKVSLPATKRALAAHLSMKDSIVNFSPDYMSFLGEMNNEVNMILSFQCTSEQIANIGVSGKAQCDDDELGVISATNCACCMMDDEFALATSRNTGVPPDYTNCNSYFDDEGPILSTLSLLASHDGGVAVKTAGEKKYDGSGDAFSSTLFGQTEIHTALVQRHTINDLMFGYPSAYLGRVAFMTQMEKAKKLAPFQSDTELAKKMLTGKMDGDLPFKLGNMGEYTSHVGSVCVSTCVAGGECSGYAPERHETSNVDKIKLGGIDCKPYTSTFETVAKCTAINAALLLDPAADGYEMCVCADGSGDWSSQGCCLAGGTHDNSDLRGEGCLYEVAGIVDPNYAGLDASGSGAMDLGTALQTWVDREVSEPSAEFLCPVSGEEDIDEHEKFGQYDSYAGSNEQITYYHTGNDRIRQDDVSKNEATAHSTMVSGSSGKYFQPKGLTVKVGTSQISDGYPMKIPHPVYVPGAKRPIDFVFEGVREHMVRNKICGTDTCIISARLKPNSTTFHAVDDETDGSGLPFNGLQPVGHMSGPSNSGRPEYFHQPLFFDGDEKLYTQQDCAYAERSDGNGINIYRPTTDADPGAFNPAASESNYQLVDKAYVDSQNEALQSHVDIEVATGLGARQRMRFGTSYSIWECNPSSNENCKLAVNAKGQNQCYGNTGSKLFEGLATADKNDLTTLGRSTPTYPCSAANLLTPQVVAGKILPMYWFEESTIHATADEIDVLAAFAQSYGEAGDTMIYVFAYFAIALYLGVSMLLLCLCFEKKHSFMEASPNNTQAEGVDNTKAIS